MIECVKYKAEHMLAILKHPSQFAAAKHISETDAKAMEGQEYAYTFLKDGEPIATIGLSKYWEGRYEAWGLLLPNHPEAFIFIHNTVRNFLHNVKVRRIEAVVENLFTRGHRWVKLLGFELECDKLKAYGPTGTDYKLYTFIKENG